MTISDLITQLELLKKEHGDLRVTRYEYGGIGVLDHTGPKLMGIRAKRKREYKTYYAQEFRNEESIEKVINI